MNCYSLAFLYLSQVVEEIFDLVGVQKNFQQLACKIGVQVKQETKWNETVAVPSIIASSQRASDRCSTSGYISYPELIQ